MKNIANFLIILSIVLVCIAIYKSDRTPPDPITITTVDTLYVYDTTFIEVSKPYKVLVDTTIYVEVPPDIDTAEILRAYYSQTVWTRNWRTPDVHISLRDTVSQNSFGEETLEIKILRPSEIINNSTTHTYISYKRSLTIGIDYPLGPRIEPVARLTWIDNKYYISAGLRFAEDKNTPEIGAGLILFRR
jgi:hypothetical protein